MTVVAVEVDTSPSSGILDASHDSADRSPDVPTRHCFRRDGDGGLLASHGRSPLSLLTTAFALIQIVLLGAISMKIGFVPRPSGELFRHQLKLRDCLDNEKVK